jgi:chromosome segregation ATPase
MKMTLSRAATMGRVVPPVRVLFLGRGALLAVLSLGLLLPVGCQDRKVQEARQQTAEAKANAAKLEVSLARAAKEITDLKAELKAVKQTRDELQAQMDRAGQERDQALTLARQAKDVITQLSTQADGQAGATAALERQVADLKALVKEQQKTIEELQKAPVAATPVDVSTEVDANQVPTPEPNDGP